MISEYELRRLSEKDMKKRVNKIIKLFERIKKEGDDELIEKLDEQLTWRDITYLPFNVAEEMHKYGFIDHITLVDAFPNKFESPDEPDEWDFDI